MEEKQDDIHRAAHGPSSSSSRHIPTSDEEKEHGAKQLQIGRHACRNIDTQAGRQIDRQAYRQAGRQTKRDR